MRWTERVSGLLRAMEDIEDSRGAELRECRDRIRRLEAQQTSPPASPGVGSQ